MMARRTFTNVPAQKPETREAMTEYLLKHFRYATDNGGQYSYAVNVKIRNLHTTSIEDDACYAMLDALDSDDQWSEVWHEFAEFTNRHNAWWEIGQNGRSGGYFVLMRGCGPDAKNRHTSAGTDEHGGDATYFDDWSTKDLRERVDLVWDFDETCERAVAAFVDFATTHKAEERTVTYQSKIVVAVPR